MIRPARPSDAAAVVELAVESGLVSPAQADEVRGLVEDFFAGTNPQGHGCLLDLDENETPVAVAYYQPGPATNRTSTLALIAVGRDRQGQGRGSALLRHLESELRHRQQQMLLVETSGVPNLTLTRAFFDKAGYTAETWAQDYYRGGDDMVLYRKDLDAEPR